MKANGENKEQYQALHLRGRYISSVFWEFRNDLILFIMECWEIIIVAYACYVYCVGICLKIKEQKRKNKRSEGT